MGFEEAGKEAAGRLEAGEAKAGARVAAAGGGEEVMPKALVLGLSSPRWSSCSLSSGGSLSVTQSGSRLPPALMTDSRLAKRNPYHTAE